MPCFDFIDHISYIFPVNVYLKISHLIYSIHIVKYAQVTFDDLKKKMCLIKGMGRQLFCFI